MSKSAENFIKAVAERAIKTFAQTFVAVVGTGIVSDKNVVAPALVAAFSAAILSMFTSIGSAQFGPHGPSLATESVELDEVSGH